jgi:uncharacterized protein
VTAEAPRPVADSERIEALDVLRGFAVLGILTMNIGSFSMPAAAYFNPTAWGDLGGLNGLIWGATHLLADLKFMALFSMLFGAGIVLMNERSASRGSPTTGLHYRRMAWLIVFGLLHAHLLWYGDVLVWYGVTGSVLYLVRRWSPRRLIAAAVTSWIVGSLILAGGGLSAASWPPDVQAEVVAELDPSEAVKRAEVDVYRSGWLAQMEHRVPKALEMETSTYFAWALWRVAGLMMLGMGLFKLGLLSARGSALTYRAMLGAALFIGVPLVALGMRYNSSIEWAAPDFFFIGSLFNYWGSLPIALGWASVVMLVCRSGALAATRRRLAAVGRTAFTNYILQTVVCTTIFYGHGLGLFGGIERTGQAAIMVGVWVLQLYASPVWVARFHYGPIEWLWRSLVYLRPQPFRRA